MATPPEEGGVGEPPPPDSDAAAVAAALAGLQQELQGLRDAASRMSLELHELMYQQASAQKTAAAEQVAQLVAALKK